MSSLSGIQHFREANALVVKLVVADGHGVIAHGSHGPQLRRLRGVKSLDQGADGEIAAIHQQSGRVHRPFLVDDGFQPGVAAALAPRSRGLGEEMGVEVMGEQNGRDVRLLGAVIGHSAGRECAQRRQQQRQKKCRKATEFHTVPPDLQ